MNKKKILYNVLTIIFISFIIIVTFSNLCHAEQLDLGDLNNYVQEPGSVPTKFRNRVNNVISIIQIIGSLLSVIVLTIIGMRYMMSSVEEKAEYKKTMVGYIIGCVLVFSIVNLLGIVYDIATSIG